MNNSDAYNRIGGDVQVEEALVSHLEKFNIAPLDAVKLFPVLVRRQWLKRFLAHAELFQRTLEIPGHIAELGVFRGNGLMTWANLLESYCVGNRTKVVYGFDNWRGFTELSPQDGRPSPEVKKSVGGFSPELFKEELQSAIQVFDSDRFIPWKARVELVDGQIEETVPKFLEENPDVRFSLVHFDCDLYKPTKVALEAIWPRVSRGGLVLFDEYALRFWAGETKAVDEFLEDKPGLRPLSLTWNNTPGAYIVKP
ncbi:MAG TPA: TylF/MycF/NovP-related O-methyltransferase [Pseudolabrys sp.]|nr:TylF/MycF/NovP-related O-methyltransferase [Pseudolabrys sp.]